MQGEHHHDREEQGDERRRGDPRHGDAVVPVPPPGADADDAADPPRGERDAEEDEHAGRDRPEADMDLLRRAEAEPDREDRQEEPGVEGIGGDLEDAVEGDEDGGVLAAPSGQPIPDQHHRDAARDADEHQAGAIVGMVGQEEPGEREHQDRPDHPVKAQGDAEEPPRAADVPQFLVLHAGEDGVHHQQEAEGDRQGDGAEPEAVEQNREPWHQRAEAEAERHRQDDPERQEASANCRMVARASRQGVNAGCPLRRKSAAKAWSVNTSPNSSAAWRYG